MSVYIVDLQIDEGNAAEMARHNVTAEEVQQVLSNAPRFLRNKGRRGATHVMIGPTYGGRLLTVPVAPTSVDGMWRPATAYDSSTGDRTRYVRERSDDYVTKQPINYPSKP